MTRLTITLAVLALGCGSSSSPSSTKKPVLKPDKPPPLASKTLKVTSGDVTLDVTTRGGNDSSPTIVVIHGGPGLSHHYTRHFFSLATPNRRVVVYDQRGAGNSTAPADVKAHTLSHYVADLEAIRLAIKAEKIHVLGHSWGGLIAMLYASKNPLQTASLILVDSLGPTFQTTDAGFKRMDARLEALAAKGLVPAKRPLPKDDDCGPRQLAMMPAYFSNPNHPKAKQLGGSTCRQSLLPQVWGVVGRYNLLENLERIRRPTLVIYGADDPFGAPMMDASAMAIRGSETTKLPKCGHLPWAECPVPFYARLRLWLKSLGA